MNKDKEFKQACREGLVSIAGLVLAMLACILIGILMQGCSPHTKYIPVESVRTEYSRDAIHRVHSDTVHDTRFIWVKGDTVVDIREKERIRNVQIHDTCYIERTDTIRVPYPVERTVEVPGSIPWWKTALIWYGGILLALRLANKILGWLIKKYNIPTK